MSNFMQTENPTHNGLTKENIYYLKCWFVLNYHGKEVFQHIFDWGFSKPISEVKTSLFQLPNYSNGKYRSDFNALQRNNIETCNVKGYDIGLLYLLLQRICSLPSPSDKQWGRDGDPDSLPNILYQIKMKRNDYAHSSPEISEEEMNNEINKLKSLYEKGLEQASAWLQIPNDVFTNVKDEINLHIQKVQNCDEEEIEVKLSTVESDNDKDDECVKLLVKAYKPIAKNIFHNKEIVRANKEAVRTVHHISSAVEAIGPCLKKVEPVAEEVANHLAGMGSSAVKETERAIKNVSKFGKMFKKKKK